MKPPQTRSRYAVDRHILFVSDVMICRPKITTYEKKQGMTHPFDSRIKSCDLSRDLLLIFQSVISISFSHSCLSLHTCVLSSNMWTTRFEMNVCNRNSPTLRRYDDRHWETVPRVREHASILHGNIKSNLEVLLEEDNDNDEHAEPTPNEQTNVKRYSCQSLSKYQQFLLPTIVESIENEQHEDHFMEINNNYNTDFDQKKNEEQEKIVQVKKNQQLILIKHPRRVKVRELLLRLVRIIKQ